MKKVAAPCSPPLLLRIWNFFVFLGMGASAGMSSGFSMRILCNTLA